MLGQTDMSTDQEHTLPLLLHLDVSDRWNRQFLSFPTPKWWAGRRVSECFSTAESPYCCFSPWRSLRECFHEKQHCKVWSPSQTPSLLQEPCLFIVLFSDPILSLSLNFFLPWFHIPYASFFFAKNKRCLIISLFWKSVVSFHYRNCDLIWSIKRILKKCVQDQSCSFFWEQKVFCNEQRIEMIIFCWNCLYFSLASSTTMNGASSERQQRERPRQIVFVTDNWSHQCKQLEGKRLHILLQWFINYQMLVIYILVQIIGLHMSFCVQAHFLSMYILNCITPKYHTYCCFLTKCLVLGRILSDHSTQHCPTLQNHNCTYMTHELCLNQDPCSTSFCQRSTPPM